MSDCIRLRPADRMPRRARVYDYDELPEELQVSIASIDGGSGGCLRAVDGGPEPEEYVRFTEYYLVTRT